MLKYFSKIFSKKKKSKIEKGRSLVEMLGVLALVGVLSVAALIGYRYAIDKYRANETFKELNSRAFILFSQLQNGKEFLSQEEFDSVTSQKYPVGFGARIEGGFYIELSDVPKGVCRLIVGEDYPYPIDVNEALDVTDTLACMPLNRMRFIYDFDSQMCVDDSPCPCGTCRKGKCITTCTKGTSCSRDINTGAETCCTYDRILNGYCCNKINEDGQCCDQNDICCPKDKPVVGRYGECVSCDGDGRINLNDPQMCARCANRVLGYQFGAGYWCGKPCKNGEIIDYAGNCHTCDERQMYKVVKTGAIHPNIIGAEALALACPKTLLRYWGDNDITVRHCDAPDQAIYVYGYEDRCNKCDNRVLVLKHNDKGATACAKKCPAGQVIGDDGNCRTCNDSGYKIYKNVSEAVALACPDTILQNINAQHAWVFKCSDADQSIDVTGYTQTCSKCKNRTLSENACVLTSGKS